MDQDERALFAELLALGATLLKAFIAAAGDGAAGESPAETSPRRPAATTGTRRWSPSWMPIGDGVFLNRSSMASLALFARCGLMWSRDANGNQDVRNCQIA